MGVFADTFYFLALGNRADEAFSSSESPLAQAI